VLLKEIPSEYKNKVSFTTNLVKKLSREDIITLTNSNVHHINISLETFNRTLYTHLTQVDHENFYTNLENIAGVFSEYPDAPKINFITMILNDNFNELVDIITTAHKMFPCSSHHLRTPYFGITDSYKKFLTDQLLTKECLDNKKEQLLDLGNDVSLDTSMNLDTYNQILSGNAKPSSEHFHKVRIESNGQMELYGEKLDLGAIDNPYSYICRYTNMLKSIKGKKVYLFGAGFVHNVWMEHYSEGLDVICVFDNDESKWETVSSSGLPVRSPSELPELLSAGDRLIITSIYHKEISNQLKVLSIKDYFVFVDSWIYPREN